MTTKKTTKKTDAPKPQGLRVVAMEVENIKRVRFAQIKPEGDLIVVSGDNGSGKTSLLDAISWAITGTSEIPSQPIRAGANSGKVAIDLGDYIVTRTFTRLDPEKNAKGNTFLSRLTIEGKDRAQYKSPQQLLDSFMGQYSFDPLAFIRMDASDQLKAMRRLVTFKVDIDALEAQMKTVYDERRITGRDLDAAKVKLDSEPAPAGDLPSQEIDRTPIENKLREAASQNDKRTEALSTQRLMQVRIESHDRQIADAQRLIAELKKRIADHEASIERTEKAKAADQAKLTKVVIPDVVDTVALTNELNEATRINMAIIRASTYRHRQQEFAELTEKYEAQDREYKRIKAEREKAIADAEMPLEGLSIGDGEVLYNGLPFIQASNAEQIRVSVAMGMAAHPKLRVMTIRDGSLLDSKSMDIIAELAESQNYQVWMERVSGDGAVGIVMEDGEASGEGVIVQKK